MRHTALIVALVALWSSSAKAQSVPDAGALMRQTEQMWRATQPQPGARRQALPPAMVWPDSAVLVRGFKFNGNQILSTAQLQATAAPFANRALTAQDAQHLTDAIAQAYRSVGWVVQVYIPVQDLSGPTLTVQILETVPPSAPR